MKHIITIAIIACFLLSCGGGDYTEDSQGSVYRIMCIDGVEYLMYSGHHNGYMAPHLKRDGKPYLCEGGTGE